MVNMPQIQGSSQPAYSDFTPAFPLITTSFADTSQLIASRTVHTSLRRADTFHAKERQACQVYL